MPSLGCSLRVARAVARLRAHGGGAGAVHCSLGHGGVAGLALLTLDAPRRANALSPRMMVALHDHVAALGAWDAGRAVVLAAVGANFCAGAGAAARWWHGVRAVPAPTRGGLRRDAQTLRSRRPPRRIVRSGWT